MSKITIFVPLLMTRVKRSLSLSKGRVNNLEIRSIRRSQSLNIKSLNH